MTNERINALYNQLEKASTPKEFSAIRDQLNREVIRSEQAKSDENRRTGRYSGVVMNTITVMR